MMDTHNLNLTDYTPVGDIIVTALCVTMAILLKQTSIQKNERFKTMLLIFVHIMISAWSNVMYETFIYSDGYVNPVWIYVCRIIHYFSQNCVLYQYIKYLQEPLWIPYAVKKRYKILSMIAVTASCVADVVGTFTRYGFYVNQDKTIHYGFNTYIIIYIMFIVTVFYMLINYRSRLIKQVFWSLLLVNIVSLVLLMVQGMHNQVSFTTVAYFLPIVGIVFLFHSNPYDIETGAVSGNYFINEVESNIEKGNEMIIISCNMLEFSKVIKTSKKLKYELYRFFRQNIRKGVLYHFPNGRLILTMIKNKNTNNNKMLENMFEDFKKNYEEFDIDYKIVIVETNPKISEPSDYMRLIEYIEKNLSFNEVHRITDSDIEKFYDSNYILSQLEDIAMKKDLNDSRVLVYCQPVFNIATGKYDTAESLMRLRLEKTGMVFPDQFIPIAEQYNIIHTLSLIILNKTCHAVHNFVDEGYDVRRISVNFSTIDIRYEKFCEEVERIIYTNAIPYEKIAVEITESRSEADFNVMKQRVIQLQKLGIKFYLDDFGTGYSNFERIMEIPFDIIKFDRSMLIESVKNDSSKFMVSTFASMFLQLNYAVLFEGVEDDRDELHCVNMNANYLQGYKYSKPIPIEELKNFLSKV